VLPMKCLPVTGEKQKIIFMCHVPSMVLILRYTEHIKHFVMSNV
jgi:hypothetical protein